MRTTCITMLAVLALAALVGCTREEARPDTFGESLRTIMRDQALNPDAGGNAPVTGMYGEAAAESMNGYTGSFGAAAEQQGVDMNEFFTLMTKGTK
ncbi:MAG: hypothetical protein AB7E47_17960 [Desulfovibrionaceae bacterium]